MSMKIIALSGSLRKGSTNTAVLKALQGLAPSGMEIEQLEIGDIPLYNQDLEAAYPSLIQAKKDKIVAADAVIFVTPEYNRSVPGVLKNAIDWLSRPYGANSFAGKLALIMGVTGGRIGTAVAQSHLKESLLYLDMQVLGQPELYLGGSGEFLDANGAIVNPKTNEMLTSALKKLASRVA